MRYLCVVAAVAAVACGSPSLHPMEALALEPAPGEPVETLQFAGHEWQVTNSPPGQSAPMTTGGFSSRHAWVDDDGFLNLRLAHEDYWQGAAVFSERRGWGYGTYSWTLENRLDGYHPSTVVGLFTYEAGAPGNREIDIEIARFGEDVPENVVVSVYRPRRDNPLFDTWRIGPETSTTHSFTWSPGWVQWVTTDAQGAVIYNHGEPTNLDPGDERVHMNLWICCGQTPDAPQHVIISDFAFTPL